MITLTRGNLLAADAEALVSTVNCEGVMGKGIALQFKKAFPENFLAYQRACRAGEVRPGRMFVYRTGSIVNPKFIVNFPTKRRWREKSRIEDIDAGLADLVRIVQELNVSSIAVPPLGSGLGGLQWRDVKPKIESAFARLPKVQVLLFEPAGPPAPAAMPVGTKRPALTLARALFIQLMKQYSQMTYRLTLLEIQKLAYLLQESGEPLRLKYVAHLYGPYAHNLNKVLEVLEGHFIQGYGDTQRPDVEIELLPGASEAADAFLTKHSDSRRRLERLSALIEGFETPYGMELLASVHWVAKHSAATATRADDAVRLVGEWNDRKRKMLKPEHIRLAWARLVDEGWVSPAEPAEAESEARRPIAP